MYRAAGIDGASSRVAGGRLQLRSAAEAQVSGC